MDNSGQLAFGKNVRKYRESSGQTQESLAADSGLDRSYIGGIERGERNPSLTVILQLAYALRIAPKLLFIGIGYEGRSISNISDGITIVEASDGLVIRFRYDRYDAEYILYGATRPQYDDLIHILRTGLAEDTSKSNAVMRTFLAATGMWPNANPSDLWTFLVNRAYCDRSNHSIASERLNLEQSWKRTSGWALERILVEHYAPFLKQNAVKLKIPSKSEKSLLLDKIDDSRIVPDKIDVVLTYSSNEEEHLLGVVHVKASIAERRTDDVPMSQALMEAGYTSVFWTMDSKSFPSHRPINRGELGESSGDIISDKRRDFEVHNHFSACFSYNQNTLPTQPSRNVRSRIYVCDFIDPDDSFSQFVIGELRQRHDQHQA